MYGTYIFFLLQLSQKSKETTLPERVVTIIGDPESNILALSFILAKVEEDPQSGSCLNISYSDIQGLVANFNPTGSPFAQNGGGSSASNATGGGGGGGSSSVASSSGGGGTERGGGSSSSGGGAGGNSSGSGGNSSDQQPMDTNNSAR